MDVLRQLMREFVFNNQIGQSSSHATSGSADLTKRQPARVQLLVAGIRFVKFLCEDHESRMQRLLLNFPTRSGNLNFVQEVINVAVVVSLKLQAVGDVFVDPRVRLGTGLWTYRGACVRC